MRRSGGGYEAEKNTVFTCAMQPYKITVPAHSTSSQYQLTVPAHSTSSQYQLTVPAHSTSSQYQLTVPAHNNKTHFNVQCSLYLSCRKVQATRFKLECNIHTYVRMYVRELALLYIISLKWVPHVLYALWYGIREICIDSC